MRAREERKSVRDKEKAEKYRQKELEKEKKETESKKQRTLDEWVTLKIPVHAAADSEWSEPESELVNKTIDDESELDNNSVVDDTDDDKTFNYNCTLRKETSRVTRVYGDALM